MENKVSLYPSLLLTLIFLLASSCKVNIKNKEQLTDYINSHQEDFKQVKEVNGINIGLTYKPWQLLFGNAKSLVDSKARHYKNKYFFILSLSAHDKELLRLLDFSTYSAITQTLSFRMASLIKVSGGGRYEEPVNCIFQPTYGTASANNLLIVINSAHLKSARYLTIVIDEFGLNLGRLTFKFNGVEINKLAQINI